MALVLASCSTTVTPRPDANLDRNTPPGDAPEPVEDASTMVDVVTMKDAPIDAPTDAPTPVDTCRGPSEPAYLSDPRLCLVTYATGVNRARGMAFAPNGDLFVVSNGSVVVLFDANGDGISDNSERSTFGSINGINHGIAFSPDQAFLYVSNDRAVYRWAYRPGLRRAESPPEQVIQGIPSGGHSTRTLMFDHRGLLYVSVGSASNVDTSPSDLALRSMIRRFTIPATLPAGGMAYTSGEIVASGMRNEVGLTMDSMGRIWGVENGRDNLIDSRFGGDIHNDNPAEELNRIDGPGPTYFGYPSCWTEMNLPDGGGPGTQHADTSVPNTSPAYHDETWCQNPANVRPPAAVMPAHWAPLGITEYTGNVLPPSWRGSLFITSHGSWNRTPPTGRLIARAEVRPDGTIGTITPIVGQRAPDGSLRQGTWNVRPVDIRQGPDGALYFTDDLGGRVFRIGYR